MKAAELSKKLQSTLKLENCPVGVKLFKVGEEMPDIAERAETMAYCASVALAREGGISPLRKRQTRVLR